MLNYKDIRNVEKIADFADMTIKQVLTIADEMNLTYGITTNGYEMQNTADASRLLFAIASR